MAVRIRSLAVSGPLLVPLTRGDTLRLSPGQVTGNLDDVDVTDNAKVEKLRAMRLIDVEQVGGSKSAAADHDDEVSAEKPRRAASRRSTEPEK